MHIHMSTHAYTCMHNPPPRSLHICICMHIRAYTGIQACKTHTNTVMRMCAKTWAAGAHLYSCYLPPATFLPQNQPKGLPPTSCHLHTSTYPLTAHYSLLTAGPLHTSIPPRTLLITTHCSPQVYPGLGMERVWNTSSDGVMESVLTGAADLTEPYWSVSGYYHGRARSERLELGPS